MTSLQHHQNVNHITYIRITAELREELCKEVHAFAGWSVVTCDISSDLKLHVKCSDKSGSQYYNLVYDLTTSREVQGRIRAIGITQEMITAFQKAVCRAF